MRMRLGLATGFAAGYFLGTKAGRERYEELQRLLAKVKGTEAYSNATDKAKAAVDLGVERAREVVDERVSGDSTPSADPASNGVASEPSFTPATTVGTPPDPSAPDKPGEPIP